MIDQASNEYGGGEESGQMIPPPSGGPFPPGAYKFSAEELRVLGECNRESFLQRSLPLGTALGLGTLAAVQKGYLKPNARMGAFPKVTLAVVVGYLLGKLSYQRACAEKLMALPNSYIGQVLRDKKNYGDRRQPYTVAPVSPVPPMPPMLGAQPGDIYSDAGPGSSLDLDLDRPLFGDDYAPPPPHDGGVGAGAGAGAGAGVGGLGAGAPQPPHSYDELRRRNRGDYTSARQDPYKVEPVPAPLVTRPRTEPRGSTNKYGDVMD